jgi:hypothetical protein
MLLTLATWSRIRHKFTSKEKLALNAAKTNEIICPPGAYLAESLLTTELRDKINKETNNATEKE